MGLAECLLCSGINIVLPGTAFFSQGVAVGLMLYCPLASLTFGSGRYRILLAEGLIHHQPMGHGQRPGIIVSTNSSISEREIANHSRGECLTPSLSYTSICMHEFPK